MGRSEPRTPGLTYTMELEELLAEAQRVALESAHAAVTIEHLLLAFVDATQARALLQLDSGSLMTLRAQIVARLMQQTGDAAAFGQIPPQDDPLTEVLTAAEARAQALGQPQVDAGSVVASLIETPSPVADWLRDLGVTVTTPTPPPKASPVAAEDAPEPPVGLQPRPDAAEAPPPPPLAPSDQFANDDEEDVVDAPTEEASVPDAGASGPATLINEPSTDYDDEVPPAPKRAAKEKGSTEDAFAEGRQSLEPAPWNVDEFDDEVPTVHAEPSTGRSQDRVPAPELEDYESIPDDEPTRFEDHRAGERVRRDHSLADETFDEVEEEDEPSVSIPRPAPGGGLTRGGESDRSLSIPPPSAPPGLADGELVENIPRRMRVDKCETIVVRLGATIGDDALRKGMQGTLTAHRIQVTQAMSARLVAPDGGFRIELASPETQWIDDPDGVRGKPAEWTWMITPTKSGTRRLQLVVGSRTVREGLIAEAALPMQIIEIEVAANYGRTFARAAQWIVATLFGAVIGVFSEEILKWAQTLTGPLP
ncbi:MAG: Clp protease N-terminal domain-containing protein [Myxococcota bacterium]